MKIQDSIQKATFTGMPEEAATLTAAHSFSPLTNPRPYIARTSLENLSLHQVNNNITRE
jgi:hypothetical protein